MGSLSKLVRRHFWGLLLLAALLVGSNVVVKSWKNSHPGAMSVLESQAMDMTVMKPPVGSVPVATEVVHLGQFSAKVTYTGSVAPMQEQVIYPRVEGTLRNLSVYAGDSVSSGQVLAVVDSPDLQSKLAEASAGSAAAASEVPAARFDVAKMNAEHAAARGEVETAKGELSRAKAMVEAMRKSVVQRQKEIKSAQANLDYWSAEIAREEKLLKSGAVSLQEFQSEKAQAAAAEAELENKQAMLDEARANVEAANAEVASKESMVLVARQQVSAASAAISGARQMVNQKSAMARQAGAMVTTAAAINEYRYVKAPFAGTVTKRYVSPGQFVTPSTAVIDVVQMDKIRLQVNVSDRDLRSIRQGAAVVARFAKDPSMTIQAAVTSVSPLADQSSRTGVVEAIVPNPGHKLVPGDSVTLDIAVSGSAESITVPSSAIVQKDDASAVWVVMKSAPKGKTEYYCTMHPEVVSDKPGKCPKCNMDLVPKESDGGKKAHLVSVSTGASDGDRIEITNGLSDGDEVIYRGNTYLKEGDAVFVTAWGADGPKEMPAAPGMGDMPGMSDMPGMPGMDHSRSAAPSPRPSSPGQGVSAAQSHAQPKAKALYYCPMHPEVTSDKPGQTCPKCGMNLEKK